jgi:hypothetical protein
MRPVRIACALVTALACAVPASADVTFKRKMDGKMMTGTMSGTSVQFIKGSKMRDDMTMAGNEMSSIIDVATQQMIALNHKNREAEIYDMAKIGAEVAAKMPTGEVQASLTPTAETRQVAGTTCTVHTMDVAAPMDLGGEKLSVRITGPVCIAKNGPGQADVAAFYKAVAEKGLFFGDVRTARAQPGQARGMTALYSEMAALGVPLAQDMTIRFEGGGAMAGMMSKMGGTSMRTEVLSVSTDPIPDSTFEIPDGYKVVMR